MRHKHSTDPKDTPTLTLPPRPYYPAFLNLKGKRVIVIGGGKVAERKIFTLLRAGAGVTVISPKITKGLEKLRRAGRIKHISREYRKKDQKNALLVIAATDSQDINKQVFKDAPCLVNVVDSPSLCNFIVPSVVKRGPLMIAVSTSGISPALSRTIRGEIKRLYSPEFASYLKLLEKIRKRVMKEIPDKKKRTEFLKSVASEEVVEILKQKGFEEVKKVLLETVRDAIKKDGS